MDLSTARSVPRAMFNVNLTDKAFEAAGYICVNSHLGQWRKDALDDSQRALYRVEFRIAQDDNFRLRDRYEVTSDLRLTPRGQVLQFARIDYLLGAQVTVEAVDTFYARAYAQLGCYPLEAG